MKKSKPNHLAQYKLVLASASPRRLALLQQVGIEPDMLRPVTIDETPNKGEMPRSLVTRLAKAKASAAREILRQEENISDTFILAADTVVVADGRLLTKPDTEAQALDMLMQLAGREHQVRTGYGLFCAGQSFRALDSVRSMG